MYLVKYFLNIEIFFIDKISNIFCFQPGFGESPGGLEAGVRRAGQGGGGAAAARQWLPHLRGGQAQVQLRSDLDKFFRGGENPWPFHTVLRVGLMVLDSLEYVHSKGYAHSR